MARTLAQRRSQRPAAGTGEGHPLSAGHPRAAGPAPAGRPSAGPSAAGPLAADGGDVDPGSETVVLPPVAPTLEQRRVLPPDAGRSAAPRDTAAPPAPAAPHAPVTTHVPVTTHAPAPAVALVDAGRWEGDRGRRDPSGAPDDHEQDTAAWLDDEPAPGPLRAGTPAAGRQVPTRQLEYRHSRDDDAHDDQHDDHHPDETDGYSLHDLDETGGLEVVGAGGGGGGGGRGGRGGGGGGGRRKRRPIAVLLSLVVLAGLVAGVFYGGRALIAQINPVAEDYAGAGSGEVKVRINPGDNLRQIGRTLVAADVIASVPPFTDAAAADPAATGIQPGVYSMQLQMSGQAALDRLLQPESKLSFGVTVREGLTVAQTFQTLSEATQIPVEQFTAAAADPAALGLPPYANGLLEGFLFPATYTFDLDEQPAAMLGDMVTRAVQALDELQVPVDQRLTVVTKASLAQAEAGSAEDMGKVARVIDNRLQQGMPLQFDTTVNYANGKSGLTTTPQDRLNPSPYNTYANPGLPPGAIDSPGEDALRATLNPTPGSWLFFVVVNPDTGETRFADTAEEHAANVLLFQQWLRDNPGG
ncbi:endolytic transglycosylase MltG [Modestobacter sp. I12A-02628]|uniref:Endolytic murein transglycosylase n=2 Tax=Goekera deserti TaxID=2497753 RepID=A0A7K3WA26_9ACTN|nr:endolytic transglycosylase MltG [Goekera deserti]NDI47497.1 endolytic transglycosylase MltG [Goekera deserti]NEL53308.1 endolytic transglycosylase MltG [Goekera deserti]